MRLIDADKLIALWYEINDIDKNDRGARFVGYTEIVRMINSIPTIDAVEVVRCKDCKYFENHCDCVKHSADILGYVIEVTDDDFCSYGERKKK